MNISNTCRVEAPNSYLNRPKHAPATFNRRKTNISKLFYNHFRLISVLPSLDSTVINNVTVFSARQRPSIATKSIIQGSVNISQCFFFFYTKLRDLMENEDSQRGGANDRVYYSLEFNRYETDNRSESVLTYKF